MSEVKGEKGEKKGEGKRGKEERRFYEEVSVSVSE